MRFPKHEESDTSGPDGYNGKRLNHSNVYIVDAKSVMNRSENSTQSFINLIPKF